MCSDSDYKSCLISANLLPLMYTFELNDIMFCIKSLQSSCPSFNIHDHIAFCSRPTRSGSFQKLSHKFSHSHFTSHFFFNRLPRLWHSLPPDVINLDETPYVNRLRLKMFLWSQLLLYFDFHNPCTYHFLCPCSKCSHSPRTPAYP